MSRRRAIVIGAGIGGISCAMRLQSLGFDTEIVEALDAPGGRAYVRRADGFVFDMGPTVLTVPHFIEELFSLEQDHAMLGEPDFPAHVLDENSRTREGISGGLKTSKYLEIMPILPFYRIYFDDGTFFDYDGDPVSTREQIKRLAPEDLEGYEAFHEQARAIFQRGFLQLGYTYFGSLGSMLGVVPDLLKLGAVQPLFSLISKYFKSDKMRQVFSFEPLLVGGNPMKVPAIYAMIHFVEKTWGIHFAKGGTGAMVSAMITKFEEMGGRIRLNAPVEQIEVQDRVATGATGRNWLFFGDQKRATDFLYEEEWQNYLAKGQLARLDTAFSRDQSAKIYVQDRMRENAAELWQWLQGGASFFVCGDAKRMAKDVDLALHEIIAAQGNLTPVAAADYVKQLKKDKRYQRDVY